MLDSKALFGSLKPTFLNALTPSATRDYLLSSAGKSNVPKLSHLLALLLNVIMWNLGVSRRKA